MSEHNATDGAGGVDRRGFLQTAAVATGAGLALAGAVGAQDEKPVSKNDDINVGVIGVGAQGRVLLEAAKDIPGVSYKAVCDIWPFHSKQARGRLKYYGPGHDAIVYEDYREMLEKHPELDAVIIATPDWMHAEHAIACLEAGLHVYCEKEMSNDLSKARDMVLAARKSGKVMQIGHQRRSNPRYLHAVNTVAHQHKLCGRFTHANAQWNRAKAEDLGYVAKYALSQETLDKYGYDSMEIFRNWRWYRKYGGGPIVDLGSHQIDIFSWIFESNPTSVIASGGMDYYKNHEWFDNVLAIFEYDTPEGVSRAFYQTLTTSSNGGYFEAFMGVDGTLSVSENPKLTNVGRESIAPAWDKWIKAGVIKEFGPVAEIAPAEGVVLDVRETPGLEKWGLPVQLTKPYHTPHLENFFAAVRKGDPKAVNCPPEIGYETAVAVLACNESILKNTKIEFKPEDFHV